MKPSGHPESSLPDDLERLARLHEQRSLSDERYEQAVLSVLEHHRGGEHAAIRRAAPTVSTEDAGRRQAGWRWGVLVGYFDLVEMAFALFGVAALVGTLFLLPGNLAAVFGRNPLAVQTVVPLLAVDFLLGLAWWHSGKGELGTLRAIGDEFIPAVPWYAPLLVVGAAATFVALTVASLSPVSFGVVLLVLKTQESLNSWVARRAIRHGAIALLRSPRADPDRKHRTLVVTDYYLSLIHI